MATSPRMYGPHVCPVCTGENYYGRFIHRGEDEVPTCPNHKDETVVLVPGSGAKIDDTVWTDGRHLA